MPRMATPVSVVGSASLTVIDAAGRQARVGVQGLTATPTSAQMDALRNALGDVTNGAVIAQNVNATTYDNVAARAVFDEAYAGVPTKAVLVFQNAARETRKLEIPAPDASIFGADGNTVDRNNTLVAALVTAYQAIVGAGFTLVRGSLTSRTRKAYSAPIPPDIDEPGAGQFPPALPADIP